MNKIKVTRYGWNPVSQSIVLKDYEYWSKSKVNWLFGGTPEVSSDHLGLLRRTRP